MKLGENDPEWEQYEVSYLDTKATCLDDEFWIDEL